MTRGAAVALALCWGAVAAAAPPTFVPFPAAGPGGWVNSAPLAAAQLRGRPVLVEFWTFDCSNCRATLPWMRALYAQYASQGLVIVAVHTPELPHERDPGAIRAAIDRLGIRYPVFLDTSWAYWNAVGNRYWPALYLYGPDGTLVASAIGEVHPGDRQAAEIEHRIRALLPTSAAYPP